MDLGYCKLFIDTDLEYCDVFSLIIEGFSGIHIRFSEIHFDWSECYLKNNDYYSLKEHDSNPGDFIYWKYYLEFYDDNNDFQSFCFGLKSFIRKLSLMGIKSVASCDFEENLK